MKCKNGSLIKVFFELHFHYIGELKLTKSSWLAHSLFICKIPLEV